MYLRRRTDGDYLKDPEYWGKVLPPHREYFGYEDFHDRMGASREDVGQLANLAEQQQLQVADINYARRCVRLSGTVQQFNRFFTISLNTYRLNSQEYRSYEGLLQIPAPLENIIEGIFGLDTRPVDVKRNYYDGFNEATPFSQISILKNLYNWPQWTADGQTIGVLEFGGGYWEQSGQAVDAELSFGFNRLPMPGIVSYSVDGAMNLPGEEIGADNETILDIFMAGGCAVGSTIVVYFAPAIPSEQNILDAFDAMIHPDPGQPRPSVLSISWAFLEFEGWLDMMQVVNTKLEEAANLGITIFSATGDTGSCFTGGDGNPVDNKAHVCFPACSPWVTACGGTIISNLIGNTFEEKTWNDTGGGATGGGISEVFDLPWWQTWSNVPLSVNNGKKGRGIPDIAGNASPYSGCILYYYEQFEYGGGTSAVAPMYAGLIATFNAGLSKRVGFLNPTLYSDAGKSCIRNIADDGNNSYSGALANTPYYNSGPGWNACTGLGVIDGMQLFHLISMGVVPRNQMILNDAVLIYLLEHGYEWPDWTGPFGEILTLTSLVRELLQRVGDKELRDRLTETLAAMRIKLRAPLIAQRNAYHSERFPADQ